MTARPARVWWTGCAPTFLALLLAAGSPAPSAVAAAEDRRVSWLREHAVPIASLDPAAGSRDLEPLGDVLDGVRVVLLGEATRGDGSAFLAKTRLVRFLHERLGFDLLVLECGFYDCARAWREARSGGDVRAALDGVLFPLYMRAAEFQPLLDLLAVRSTTERPLEIAGFDYQSSHESSGGGRLVGALRAALGAALDRQTDAALERAAPLLEALSAEAYATGEQPVPPAAERQRLLDALELLRERFASLRATGVTGPRGAVVPARGDSRAAAGAVAPDVDWWLQTLDNVETWARASWLAGRFDPRVPVPIELHNMRDRRMAENLLWLVRRDPSRKVVVWSLTVHLARDLDRLATGDEALRSRFGEMSAVGDLVVRELGPQAYTIAITAAQGSKGTPFRAPVPLLEPTAGSFEDLMARTGLETAFLDLRRESEGGRWLRRGLIARPISYVELLAIWPRHLDGLLFVRTMQPARRVE